MQSWYIACTKPNAERYAAQVLSAKERGFTVYAPKVLTRISHAGRVSEVERPFLPRYIFVLNDGKSVRGIRAAPGVSSLMPGCDGPALASQIVIDAIKKRETKGYVDLDVYLTKVDPRGFKKGQVLRVVEGPFSGFNAIFQERDPHNRVIAFIHIFGQSSKMTLEANQVERAQ